MKKWLLILGLFLGCLALWFFTRSPTSPAESAEYPSEESLLDTEPELNATAPPTVSMDDPPEPSTSPNPTTASEKTPPHFDGFPVLSGERKELMIQRLNPPTEDLVERIEATPITEHVLPGLYQGVYTDLAISPDQIFEFWLQVRKTDEAVPQPEWIAWQSPGRPGNIDLGSFRSPFAAFDRDKELVWHWDPSALTPVVKVQSCREIVVVPKRATHDIKNFNATVMCRMSESEINPVGQMALNAAPASRQ